ncbi:PIN domain-containing protein [Fimicolochytrium jonesii]|uniref:PIN domain-containing protein n=1 Tax=Fimicolochytrium jonesii TaxID=1396493 RepID=UPI0022FEC11A|nr:PIN domain-containing protein [Fimicolochytrium jonesii]KAI8820081.1 PIN domain-containing protein [Fimicolochytrium jonesii]
MAALYDPDGMDMDLTDQQPPHAPAYPNTATASPSTLQDGYQEQAQAAYFHHQYAQYQAQGFGAYGHVQGQPPHTPLNHSHHGPLSAPPSHRVTPAAAIPPPPSPATPAPPTPVTSDTILSSIPPSSTLAILILDTNYLISHLPFLQRLLPALAHDPNFLIVIPYVVVTELDGLKESWKKSQAKIAETARERGREFDVGGKSERPDVARRAIDFLFRGMARGVRGLVGQTRKDVLGDVGEERGNGDDQILECCRYVQNRITPRVMLMSNDKNLCLKALIHGIQTVTNYSTSTPGEFLDQARSHLGLPPAPPLPASTSESNHIAAPQQQQRRASVSKDTTASNVSIHARKTTTYKNPELPPPPPREAPSNADSKKEKKKKKKKKKSPELGGTSSAGESMDMEVDEDAKAGTPTRSKKRKASEESPEPPSEPSRKKQPPSKPQPQNQDPPRKKARTDELDIDALGLRIHDHLLTTLTPPFTTLLRRHLPKPSLARQPPWSLDDLFILIDKHWSTVFARYLGKTVKSELAVVTCVAKCLARAKVRTAVGTGATRGELGVLVRTAKGLAALVRAAAGAEGKGVGKKEEAEWKEGLDGFEKALA